MQKYSYLIIITPMVICAAYYIRVLVKTKNMSIKKITIITTLLSFFGSLIDRVFIYFEVWTFPLKTHLFDIPIWPQKTYYGNAMNVPFEEFFIFNPTIIWFVLWIVSFLNNKIK